MFSKERVHMKKQIILMAALAVALTACGKDTEETGKAAVDAGKKVVETAEKVVKETKEVVEPKMAEPADQTAASVDGKSVYGACAGCHGPDGKMEALGVGAVIAGQSKDDLIMKIKGYKDGSYGGPMKASMAPLVANLNDDQIAAVAEYISGL